MVRYTVLVVREAGAGGTCGAALCGEAAGGEAVAAAHHTCLHARLGLQHALQEALLVVQVHKLVLCLLGWHSASGGRWPASFIYQYYPAASLPQTGKIQLSVARGEGSMYGARDACLAAKPRHLYLRPDVMGTKQ